MPCRILKNTRLCRFHAEPQRKELVVNRTIEKIKYLFLPKILLNQPVRGMIIAFDTR
jgi:hypothetical protein